MHGIHFFRPRTPRGGSRCKSVRIPEWQPGVHSDPTRPQCKWPDQGGGREETAAPPPLDEEEEEVIEEIGDHSPDGDLVIEVTEGLQLPDQNGAA